MRTILLIEGDKQQVVFTPENDHEKNILKLIESKQVDVSMKVGNFSECQGGWTRYYSMSPFQDSDHIDSLMLVLKPFKEYKCNNCNNNGAEGCDCCISENKPNSEPSHYVDNLKG